MSAFQDLTKAGNKLVQIDFDIKKKKKKATSKNANGCSHCVMDKDPNARKIKGLKRIKGKKVFIWMRNPSNQDTLEGMEAVGPAGKFLWAALKEVGIGREDCDVQNVVRCQVIKENADTGDWEDVEPSRDIAKCCSKYTERALVLNDGKAKVHLVFGLYAAKTLLGREFKKTDPIFWSKRLNATVVCLDHPSYFLQGGSEHRLKAWKERLALSVSFLKHSGRYSFLKQQDYTLLYKSSEVNAYLKYIKKFALTKGRQIVVDIEEGWTYKNWSSDKLRAREIDSTHPGAQRSMLIVGFCHAPGRSRSIVLDHPDNPMSDRTRHRIRVLLKDFLEDKRISKVFHYGCSDTTAIKDIMGITVRGYDFDTNHSTYLMWPELKKYGLESLAKEKVPEFSGYKDIIKEYLVPNKVNYATIPLKIHRLYNGGDCDLTKRLEILTRDPLFERSKHSKPLLRTYRDVDFTLKDITPRGPFFDYKYAKEFKGSLRLRLKTALRKCRKIAKWKEFNPRAHAQVKDVIYSRLGLPEIEVKRKIGRTDENTLKVLQAKTKHKFIDAILDYRGLSVMDRTTLRGYEECANVYEGRLRTTWWLTGGITGRLRSGGKDKKSIVNLQNINKKAVIKNLLVSDLSWRKIGGWFKEKAWSKIFKRKVFLIADYSAIELRVFAEIAEPKFVKIFNSGKDAHGLMGSGFTDWTYQQIQDDEEIRTKVKNINFGVPYGMGKQSFFEGLIARGTKITRKESDKLYDAYFVEYTGVARFQKESQAFAEKHGYVPTMFGFHRPILHADDDSRTTFWGNQAINSRIQGSAHQYLLFAMALLHTAKKRFFALQELSMEIHDALAFFSAVKMMKKAWAQIRELMTEAVPEYIERNFKYQLKVPLECDVKAGFRLGTMIKYKGEHPEDFVGAWLKVNEESSKKLNDEWEMAA